MLNVYLRLPLDWYRLYQSAQEPINSPSPKAFYEHTSPIAITARFVNPGVWANKRRSEA